MLHLTQSMLLRSTRGAVLNKKSCLDLTLDVFRLGSIVAIGLVRTGYLGLNIVIPIPVCLVLMSVDHYYCKLSPFALRMRPQQNRVCANLTTGGDNAGGARYRSASEEAGEPYTKCAEWHCSGSAPRVKCGRPGLVAKLQSQQAEHVHGSILVTVHPHACTRSWTASVGTDEDL